LLEIESLNEDFLNMRNVSPTSPEGNAQSPEYNIRTQITVLQSRPVLQRMIQKLNLDNRLLANAQKHHALPWGQPKPLREQRKTSQLSDQAASIAAAALRIRPQPNTRVLEVTFDSTDAQIAADLANSLTSAFTEVTLENRWRATQNTSEWLTRQVQDVKAKLQKSEDALQKYANASNLTFMSETGQLDTTAEQRLKQLQVELSQAEAYRVERQSRYELASTSPVDSLPDVIDNPTLREYQVQLTTLRRQLADLSSSFTAEYPKVVSIRAQIATLERALEKERSNIISRVRNEYEAAVRREKLISKNYNDVIRVVSAQAEKVNHYSLLKREVDTTRQLYESMVQRVKEADLASAMKATDIHVIESAAAPLIPYKPVPLLNMGFGLVSGVCLGAMIIIQRARSNTRIEDPGDTAIELNVPELGIIPASVRPRPPQFLRLLGKSVSAVSRHRPELTTWQQPPSVLAESFRLTLASILLSSKDGVRPSVIAVSSANAGEGKTTVVSNLAIALARINKRVLLIDGDFRKHRLHRIFEVENTAGLNQALTGEAPVSIRATKVPNLFLLPSGNGTHHEMLFFTSQVRDVLQRLKREFDMILIDTPPLLQVADARLLCHASDAIVLVVAQHTPREAAFLARQRLADDGSNLLGTILNKWDPKASLQGYKSYYGNYYNEYGADKQAT
jgi:polysaccharide biosynthesis transport protein